MIKEDDHIEVKTDEDNPTIDTDKKDVPSAIKEMEESKAGSCTDENKDVPSAIKELEESKAEGCTDENKDETLAEIDIKVPDTKDEEDNHIADQ